MVVALVFYFDGDRFGFLWVAAFTFGFLLWTFVEYWVHRSILHGFYWHGTHERHHNHPTEHVLFPIWYVPGLFAMFFIFAWVLSFAWSFAFAAYGGFALGYVWFTIMHHLLHHVDLEPHTWLHQYAIWHNRHHKLNDRNFGITTNLWDIVFGTSR